MNPLNPLFAVACLLLAFGTAHLLMRFRGAPSESGRFASIDGLRGFLAFSVFIHHASVWYFYLPTDIWDSSPSRLYTQLGQTSVELFFMITAFLFIHKVAGPSKQISWPTLFIHRLFRLGPLYLFAMICFLTLVAYLSQWRLDGSVLQVGIEALRWVLFDIGGLENVNHLPMTYVVIAAVPWSLQYEWAFYVSLPFIALGLRRNASIWVLLVCAVLLVVASVKLAESGRFFYAFAGAVRSRPMPSSFRGCAGSRDRGPGRSWS